MFVTLDESELGLARYVGARRYEEAVADGKRDSNGFQGDGRLIHYEGACGEVAAAKALNVFYNGSINTYKAGADVGGIQVRTRSKSWYDLIVRAQDRDDDLFLLVTGVPPTFEICGWTTGAAAKQATYLRDHGGRPPAYFVPRDALHPVAALYRTVHLAHAESFAALAASGAH